MSERINDACFLLSKQLHTLKKEIGEAKDAGICIRCKKPPTFYSKPGEAEYQISALCEPCFDEITKEED